MKARMWRLVSVEYMRFIEVSNEGPDALGRGAEHYDGAAVACGCVIAGLPHRPLAQ